MNKLYSRRQVRLHDPRQLFRPEQLEPRMPVAGVLVLEGTSVRQRLAKAGFSFALAALAEQPEESAFSAARRGWNHNDLEGAVPRWRGAVQGHTHDGVVIEVTGQPSEPDNWKELVGTDPADLPEIAEPILHFATYASLGLVAVHGQWERAATLSLGQ